MENFHVEKPEQGLFVARFDVDYLVSQGIVVQNTVKDKNFVDKLIRLVLSSQGYTEEQISKEGYLLEMSIVYSDIYLNIFTPHTLTKHPYIVNGEEYDLPESPETFVSQPLAYLDGCVCECSGCTLYRILRSMTGWENIEEHEELESDVANSGVDAQRELENKPSKIKNRQGTLYKPRQLVYRFKDIENIITVSKILWEVFAQETSLYLYKNYYYLVYDFSDYEEFVDIEEIKKNLTSVQYEYDGVRVNTTKYFLAEYGKEIIAEDVFNTLLQYFQ